MSAVSTFKSQFTHDHTFSVLNHFRAIDKLPRTLGAIAENIKNQTSWNVTILLVVGGRMPGKQTISTYALVISSGISCHKLTTWCSYHSGTMDNGRDFAKWLGDNEYDDKILAPFDDFLHEAFRK